jgi:hypothetical protein
MTYRDMSFYSPSASFFWQINYAKHAPLRPSMQLAQVERYYHYGYFRCGLRVFFFMRLSKKYLVSVRPHHILFLRIPDPYVLQFSEPYAFSFLRHHCGSLSRPKAQLHNSLRLISWQMISYPTPLRMVFRHVYLSFDSGHIILSCSYTTPRSIFRLSACTYHLSSMR